MLPYEAHFLGYHFCSVDGYGDRLYLCKFHVRIDAHFYSSMVHVFNFLRHKHNHIPIVLMF